MPIGSLLDFIRPYAHLALPLFYIVFVLGTVAVFVISERKYAKETFLTGFFSILLITTLIGVPILPVIDMHKFANPTEEETTAHEITIVDEHGNELYYDSRAIEPVMGTRVLSLGSNLISGDDTYRMEVGTFLIESAEEYRLDVESGEAGTEFWEPPRYLDESQWTTEDLDGVGSFETIRVYNTTYTFSDDNTEINEQESYLELEVDVANDEIRDRRQA